MIFVPESPTDCHSLHTKCKITARKEVMNYHHKTRLELHSNSLSSFHREGSRFTKKACILWKFPWAIKKRNRPPVGTPRCSNFSMNGFSFTSSKFPLWSHLTHWINNPIYCCKSSLDLRIILIIMTFSNLQLKYHINLHLLQTLWRNSFKAKTADFSPKKCKFHPRLLMLKMKNTVRFHFLCTQFCEVT